MLNLSSGGILLLLLLLLVPRSGGTRYSFRAQVLLRSMTSIQMARSYILFIVILSYVISHAALVKLKRLSLLRQLSHPFPLHSWRNLVGIREMCHCSLQGSCLPALRRHCHLHLLGFCCWYVSLVILLCVQNSTWFALIVSRRLWFREEWLLGNAWHNELSRLDKW